jgi:hypothetical protein
VSVSRAAFSVTPGESGMPKGRGARARLDQERIGVAVVAARELDQCGSAGGRARDARSAHRGLGAGGDEAHHVAAGHHRSDALGQLDLGGRGEPEQQAAGGGDLHGGHDLGPRVTEERGSPGADPVHVLAARLVAHARAVRLGDRDRRGAHRAERAHRRMHAAGCDGSGPRQPGRGLRLAHRFAPGLEPRAWRAHRAASARATRSAMRSASVRAK